MARITRLTARDREIGLELKRRREQLGLTQTEFGDLFGISYQQVGKYEKGQDSLRVTLWETMNDTLREREVTTGFSEEAQSSFQPPPARHPAKDELLNIAKRLEGDAKRLREMSDQL